MTLQHAPLSLNKFISLIVNENDCFYKTYQSSTSNECCKSLRSCKQRYTPIFVLGNHIPKLAFFSEIFEHAELPTAQNSEPLRKLFVVISSDKGLCGGIHSSVSKGTRRILATGTISADGPDAKSQNTPEQHNAIPAADSPIVVIGDKSKAQLSRTVPKNFVLSMNQIGKDVPTFADAAVVTDLIVKSGVKYDSVLIVYNKYVSAVAFEASTIEVLNEKGLREARAYIFNCVSRMSH